MISSGVERTLISSRIGKARISVGHRELGKAIGVKPILILLRVPKG